MSTSSARPADLDAWVTASRGLDDALEVHKSTLIRLHGEFTGSLGWGHFDASSMLTAFGNWLSWNEIDAQWVTTIAQAFRAADSGTVPDAAIDAALQAAGLDFGRQSVTFDDPVALGEPPTSGYANDPVNTGSGNFVEVEIDLLANGLTRLLRFARTYNSRSDRVGPFGPGWASWATARLRSEPDGAHWEAPDGQRAVFPWVPDAAAGSGSTSGNGAASGDGAASGSGSAAGDGSGGDGEPEGTHAPGRYGRLADIPGLVVPAGDGLAMEWFGGGRLVFDAAGLPLLADDGPGTEVTFEHDGDRLVGMRHAGGRALTFEWRGDRIVVVRCSDGRAVSYGYDERGRLIEAEGPAGRRLYEVDDAGRVVAVTDADGVVEARNTYDDDGRVLSQLSPHGRRTRFRYLPGRVTIVDDDEGGPTNSYVHDDRGRLVGAVDGHGNELTKSYDRWGNPTSVTERNGAHTVFEWDDRSRIVRRTQPDGSWFAFTHDDHDRVVEVTSSTGSTTRYRYEGAERSPVEIVDPEGGVTRLTVEGGLVRSVTDPDGVEVRFRFDADGELTAVTDAAGNTGTVERDAAGRVTATVSPSGLRTELAYDGTGRLVERRDPGGAVTRFEWSAAGRLVATVDPLGARTELRHGADGEAEQVVDPLGHVTSRRFDALGNLVGVVLPDGAKWELTYDGLCRLTAIHDPAGATWLREYDANGNLVGTVDPAGVHRRATVDRVGRITGVDDGLATVSFELDDLGRAAVHRRADGTELRATYDRCGRTTSVTDPLGNVTRYEHTPAGRLAAVTTRGGATTRYEYDSCGRRVAFVDPLGHRWSVRHDADGRVTQVVSPAGEIERLRYDGAGRLAARVSPSGGTTRYEYDAAGRLVSVTDPAGGVRRFAWDLRGGLVSATDPNGGTTRYERDVRGLVRTLTDPLGGTVEHRYDPVGRLVARTDQLGRTTEWEYDAAGRVTRRVLPTGDRIRLWHDPSGRVRALGVDDEVVEISRDRLGRPVEVTEPGFRHTFRWDDAGRLLAKRRGDVGLAWRYDADGRPVAVTTPDGAEAAYGYDAAGRLVATSHPGLGALAFERDEAGRLVGLTGPEGASWSERWTYEDGSLASHEVVRGGERRVTTLERDGAGRIVGLTSGDGSRVAFRYDAGGQLVGVDGPGGERAFRYDAAGRLVAETGPDGSVAYEHDAAHQLLSRTEGSGSGGGDGAAVTRYAYDAAGRRVGATGPDGATRTLAWDWLDRLSGVGDTRLVADALDDLAEVDGHALLWDPVAALPQLRWAGGATVVGADRPWAVVGAAGGPDPSGLVARPDATGIGGLGALAGIGALAGDPWGGGTAAAALPGPLGLGRHGELQVDGLVWLRNRTYDPATRAFLSVDPVAGVPGDPFSATPYHYAGNDPVNALDPLGLRPMTEAELLDYREAQSRNFFERAGDWVEDNWEYIAAGAMIVGGIAIMATGVGGPIGAAMIGGALLSGGISAGSQRMMTGQVDWGQVGVDMAIGAIGGGTGAAITSTTTVSRVATTTIGRGIIAGGAEGLVGGVANQGVNYLRTGEFDPTAVARDTLIGGVTGGGGAYVQERAVLGPLQRVGPDTFESRNTGLVYGPDRRYGNRVNHVLRHTVDDPNRQVAHGVFDSDRHVFDVVDDAYTRSQTATTGVAREPTQTMNWGAQRDRAVVPMGDDVGYIGGQPGAAAGHPSSSHVQLVIDDGNQLATTFPIAGIPMGS